MHVHRVAISPVFGLYIESQKTTCEKASVYRGFLDPHSYHIKPLKWYEARLIAAASWRGLTWYDSYMPHALPTKDLAAADAAIVLARSIRARHRRLTDRNSERRVEDIRHALGRLSAAMKPLRSEIGKFPYGPQTTIAEKNRTRIREASAALQVERRKLWKMLTPSQRRAA